MDQQSKINLRRRLLKGGLAGPAVFTIASGTAWAQSVTCLEKNPRRGQQGFPAVRASSQDEWMRKAVTSFNLGGPTAIQSLGARSSESRFVLADNGQYRELVERRLNTVTGPVVGVVTRETGLSPGIGVNEQNKRTDFFLIAYDLDGQEIMYQGEGFPAQGFIAYASGGMNPPPCVASIQMRRRNLG